MAHLLGFTPCTWMASMNEGGIVAHRATRSQWRALYGRELVS